MTDGNDRLAARQAEPFPAAAHFLDSAATGDDHGR